METLTAAADKIWRSSFYLEKYSVVLGMKKAYDTRNDNCLCIKLDFDDVRCFVLTLSNFYFQKWYQCDFIFWNWSTLRQLTCGVPRGSIRGCLFFILYSIHLPSLCRILQYFLLADDKTLLLEIPSSLSFGLANLDLPWLPYWLKIKTLGLVLHKL